MTSRQRSWLCPTEMDRARLVDMDARVRGARRVQGLTLCGVALLATPWAGWWLGVLVLAGGGVLVLLERAMPTARQPHRLSATAIAACDVVLAAAAAGTGGARSPLAGWLLVPTVMFAARFRPRVVVAGVVATGVLAGTAFAIAAALPAPAPLPLPVACAAWGATLVGVVAAVLALLSAELHSRDDAVVDPLTGLYNRAALVGRFAQAAEQALVLRGWLGIVMCDLDHFKAVNDTYGHDTGDEVLRAVAAQMRTTLRSFDMVYRFGGEEFLVLLPGQDLAAATAIAERLRAAVEQLPFDGFAVTLSAGVSSGSGSGLEFDRLLHVADQALYRAKSQGRNRVLATPADPAGPADQADPGTRLVVTGSRAGRTPRAG
jgi:diguanylate cyclase (GGDEF)-like protein